MKNKARSNEGLSQFLVANVEPFASQAVGAKVPDQSTYPSLALKSYSTFQGTTNATGYYTVAIYPSLAQQTYFPGTTAATTVWAAGASYAAADYAAIAAVISQYRVVGGGVRIKGLEALNTAKGSLVVAHCPWDISATLSGSALFPTTKGGYGKLPLHESVSLADLSDEVFEIPFKRLDTGSQRYRFENYPNAVSPYAETSPGWAAICVYIDGATVSAGVVDIEVILHVEALQSSGDSLISSSIAQPYNEKAMGETYKAITVSPAARHVDGVGDMLNWARKINNLVKKHTGKDVVGHATDFGFGLLAGLL